MLFGLAGDMADCHTREGYREEVVIGIKEKRHLKQMIKDLEQLAVSFPGEKRLVGRERRLKQLCQELMNDFGAKRLKKRLHNGGLFKKTRLYTRISEYTVQLR